MKNSIKLVFRKGDNDLLISTTKIGKRSFIAVAPPELELRPGIWYMCSTRLTKSKKGLVVLKAEACKDKLSIFHKHNSEENLIKVLNNDKYVIGVYNPVENTNFESIKGPLEELFKNRKIYISRDEFDSFLGKLQEECALVTEIYRKNLVKAYKAQAKVEPSKLSIAA